MRLVKLHRENGECVYVNPSQVVHVEPQPFFATPAGERLVRQVGAGSKISFALVGHACADGNLTDNDPYAITVKESPKELAGLFLEPQGWS